MKDLLSGLNPEQKKAAEQLRGPVLVLAGAGSGKTRTLTYRTANLIDYGIEPENILTLTFTNKAAKNMKEKISELIGEEKADKIWMGTFHSIGLRILRNNANKIGYFKDISIYNTNESVLLLNDIISDPRLAISKEQYNPKIIIHIISKIKNETILPKDAEEFVRKNYRNSAYEPRRIAQIYRLYEKMKQKYNAFDFDDLILKPIILFREHPKILKFYQKKFQYVQIDEYQDSNTSQYIFSKMLANPQNNLMVVGDDDQAIYGFRGADFTNILNFNKDFKNVFEVKLERNYRSASVIVETANNLIQHNNMRKGKASYANEDKDGGDVRVAASRNNEEEGRFISEEIKRLVNKESYDYKDITILYRVNSQSFQMEKYLNKYSIPYEVIGGTKFLERKECQMFLGFLQFSLNPLDDLNISSIIGYYRNNLGRTTIKKLKEYSFENNISLLETMKNPEKVKGIGKSRAKSITQFLKNYLIPMNQLKDFNLPLMDIVKRVDKISDIERLLNNMSNSRDRKENLEQLKVYMFDIIEKNKEYSLEDLLDHVKLHSGQEVMSESEEESDNKVKLMTAHSSKGLEFPVVFVIGLEEKLFPHSFAINEGTELAIEEERRLAYVAFTRAEEKLYLSYAKFRYKYGQGMPTVRSRFLDELVS